MLARGGSAEDSQHLRRLKAVSGAPCDKLRGESKVLIFGREILSDRDGPQRGSNVRTGVVTGGGSGIGLAVAQRLRRDGHRIATIDLKPSEAASSDTFSFTADVTDRAQVDAALSAIRDQLGPVTVLVNAAGLDGFKRFTHIDFKDWQRIIDVNLNGVFHMIQAVLPDMIEAGWGRIVNISSSSTHSGTPYMSHYVAAKSAVNGLTKSLALEYGPSGITVNAVPPGFIDTPMLRNAAEHGYLGDIEKSIAATPVRRIGKPEDIAAACAFLVSEEAGYITGQILGVNGGRNT
jgi:2-hydroxycyclohexanecarboxyl-CoA dehydrogenase